MSYWRPLDEDKNKEKEISPKQTSIMNNNNNNPTNSSRNNTKNNDNLSNVSQSQNLALNLGKNQISQIK